MKRRVCAALLALDLALSNIEKQFGKGSIMKLGQTANMNVQVIPSGCLELDIALGVGRRFLWRRMLYSTTFGYGRMFRNDGRSDIHKSWYLWRYA